jgi:cell division transport system ATP-binding protein
MISLENVSKKFGTGTFAIADVTFSVEKGEFVFLTGPTGSGKTTIFRMLIREMIPTKGSIVVNSWDLIKLPGSKVSELRKMIGVVFQDLKLLPDRTIIENILLPLEVAGVKSTEAKKRAQEILEHVGILEHAEKFPVQLSGGERQRAAIARALILNPQILLADEPTGDLDDETAWEIVKLLSQINENGTTIVMATHNHDIIKKLNKRIISLDKGSLVNDNEKKEHKKDKDHEEKEEKKEEAEEDTAKKEKDSEENKKEAKEEKKEKKDITDDFEEALK